MQNAADFNWDEIMMRRIDNGFTTARMKRLWYKFAPFIQGERILTGKEGRGEAQLYDKAVYNVLLSRHAMRRNELEANNPPPTSQI